MLITQAPDFAWRNKFIDTFATSLLTPLLQVSHLFVSDLKKKAK